MTVAFHRLAAVAAGTLVLSLAGCGKATKAYPEALPGWHNADYSTVYGRLLRIPAQKADDPPVWVVRYGLAADQYRGELAITPPEVLIGYKGGEMVEIRGAVHPELAPAPDHPATWIEVQSMRLWSNYR
jgi:hypothetical protein